MTYREMLLQTDPTTAYTSDIGIEYAKELFKTNNKPYSLKDGVDGPKTRVVFNEHFIYVMRDADSNECMAKMSQLEKELYWDYTQYQTIVNSIMLNNPTFTDAEVDAAAKTQYELETVYKTPEMVVRTLSDWAYAELLQFDKDTCYTTMHSWEV